MERRLAAILAADVMGYSRLTERDEEASTATLRMYRAVVEESITAHRGHIFSSAGDGVVAEFPSIVEAIRCAVEIQNEIAERNASVPKDDQMQFRIGVNLGDVIVEDNDLYGTGVNVAVRLEQLAQPGGICISQTVYDQVRKIVEIPFQDIGERRLKNIADPVHVYRILPEPLPWLNRVLSRIWRSPRLGAAAGVAVLLLALGASFYLRQPAVFWDAVLGEGALPEHPTIAVMPFDDMSPSGDQGYLADGVTEELITGLAKFRDLVVMARTSTLVYKDKPTDIRQVGKDLHVRYVVEGSVQRSDSDVRVTAQLIDANTGSHIWADRFDRKLDNIFEIRDEITRDIAGALGGLRGELARAEMERLAAKNPNSFTAYEAAMRGWSDYYKFDPESNAAGREFFEQARTTDPNYARAYAGLAWTYSSDYDFEWTDDFDTALKHVFDYASTAVRLDPNDYQGHWALGWAQLYKREYERAAASYARARELNPNDAEVLAEMGNFLVFIDQIPQAINQLKEAIKLNPNHDRWYVDYLGWAYEHAGMYKEAIDTIEPVIEDPVPDDQLWLLPTLAVAYAKDGRMDDAKKTVETFLSRKPEYSILKELSRLPYKTKEQRDRYVSELKDVGLPE
jgi:TolB-like protein/class 3 adenylate cyclase/cytochrome c-type biogenesis protein CcmH/NrfG